MWEFNYGEWTEAYVFLRLLGNGRIYAADDTFSRNERVYMDIINVIRFERDHILKFERDITSSIVNASDNSVHFRILAFSELQEKADLLYDSIRRITSANRKFSVPDIEEYLKELRFSKPKVPDLPREVAEEYGSKTDIIFSFEDSTDHSVSTTGFSIKSHLGSNPTLFNSALSSRFVYEIIGCNESEMNELNANQIDSETGMFQYIKNNENLSLRFVGTSEEFQANLDFVELQMAKILNCALLIQIGYYENSASHNIKDIFAKVSELNPVGVRRPEMWYKAKMKEFLFDSFAGLTATEPWNGRRLLSGGYIDVNALGEILYYRAISDDIFSSYLYENTYIDRPARGVNKDVAKVIALAKLQNREPTEQEIHDVAYKMERGCEKRKPKKGDWGYVYKDGDRYYITINFQVRFR